MFEISDNWRYKGLSYAEPIILPSVPSSLTDLIFPADVSTLCLHVIFRVRCTVEIGEEFQEIFIIHKLLFKKAVSFIRQLTVVYTTVNAFQTMTDHLENP